MLRIYTLLSLLALCFSLFAQTSDGCFSSARSKGIQAFSANRPDYDLAISQFFLALNCADCPEENDVLAWLKRAQEAQVRSLEVEVSSRKVAERAAIAAAKEARLARIVAEENGQRAEALRLGLLADEERLQKRYLPARQLLGLAFDLGDDEVDTETVLVYAKLMQEADMKHVTTNKTLTSWQYLDNKLLLWDEDGLHVFDDERYEAIATTLSLGPILAADTDTWIGATPGNSESLTVCQLKADFELQIVGRGDYKFKTASIGQQQFLIGGRNDNLEWIDRRDGVMKNLSGHTSFIYQLLQAGDFTYSRSSDGSVRAWSSTGEAHAMFDQQGVYLHTMSLSANERQLVLGSATGDMFFLSLPDLKLLATHKIGEHAIVEITPLNNVPNVLITKDVNGDISLYDTTKDAALQLPVESGRIVCFVTTNQGVILGTDEGKLLMYNLSTDKFDILRAHDTPVQEVDFADETGRMLSLSEAGELLMWDENQNILLRKYIGFQTQQSISFIDSGRSFINIAPDGKGLDVTPDPLVWLAENIGELQVSPADTKLLAERFNLKFVGITVE